MVVWSPAVEQPASPAKRTDGDDGGGQAEVCVDAVAAAFGAAAELAEVVEPGVGPLHRSPLAHLERRRCAAGGDLAASAALLERCSAGPVVTTGVQVHRHLGREGREVLERVQRLRQEG